MPSPCQCSLILPTRNRRAVLVDTLTRLQSLPDADFEVIVVDNGSTDDTDELSRRFPGIHWIFLGDNLGAAARNVGAVAARGSVLLMLDDDSWPDPGVIDGLVEAFATRPDLGAVACRVRLADRPERHDAGGVPGVFFNCGGAVRRAAFMEAGGYPVDFDYYVEEYDLCCRLWRDGWRVEPHGHFTVWHRRVTLNRDNHRMLRLLVRNNLRLWQRYAPEPLRADLIASTVERYRRVAMKEQAMDGYRQGLEKGRAEIAEGLIRPLPLNMDQMDGLFGLPAAREAVRRWAEEGGIERVAVWSRGKGCEQLLDVVRAGNIAVEAVYDTTVDAGEWRGTLLRPIESFEPHRVDGIVAGTLSPGVAEDTVDHLRARFGEVPVLSAAPWMAAQPAETAAALQ